jgi:hypothetical protein
MYKQFNYKGYTFEDQYLLEKYVTENKKNDNIEKLKKKIIPTHTTEDLIFRAYISVTFLYYLIDSIYIL